MVDRTDEQGFAPLPFGIGRAAAGYFLAAVACTVAGYSMGQTLSEPWRASVGRLVWLWGLLLPAYIVRALLYEHVGLRSFVSVGNRSAAIRHMTSQATEYLVIVFAVILAFMWFTLPTPSAMDAVALVCAATPIWTMTARLMAKWSNDGRFYHFRFRSFFPALATCLPPFLFGYFNSASWYCIAVGSALVIGYWGAGFYLRRPRHLGILGGVTLLTVATITALTIRNATPVVECIRVISFGSLLTLAMGVSESSRVTARVLQDIEFRPGTPFSDDERRYYLAGTNVATALCLPFFIATGMHPNASSLYFSLITIVAATQYCIWFGDSRPTKSPLWPSIGFVTGLTMPVVVTAVDAGTVATLPFSRVPTSFWEITGSVALPWALGGFVENRVKPLRTLRSHGLRDTFTDVRMCIALTSIASGVLGGLLMVLPTIFRLIPFGALTDAIASHYATPATTYFLIQLICSTVLLLMAWMDGQPALVSADPATGTTGGDSREITQSRGVAIAWALCRSARLGPSAIAGILCGATLTSSPSASIDITTIIAAALAMALLAMFGFVVNDIFDVEKDRQAGVDRPIARRELTIRSASIFAMCLAIVSIGTAVRVGAPEIVVVGLCSLFLYTPLAHRAPTFKGIYTAAVCLLPVWYALKIGHLKVGLTVLLAMAIFVFGREMMLDAKDIVGDSSWGLKTIAARIGSHAALRWAAILMVLGSILAAVSAPNVLGRLLATISAVVTISILALPLSIHRRGLLTRLPMLLGALAVAVSAS